MVGKKRLTDEQRAENKRKTQERINREQREVLFKGVHGKANKHEVKCPMCGTIHLHTADIKWRYCYDCNQKAQNIAGEEYSLVI